MLLPGLSEGYMSPRARLYIALGICLAIIPMLLDKMPPMPDSAVKLFLLVAKEIMVGVFIGAVIKILFATLSTAGAIIASQTGLGSAMLFDPSQSEQGSAISVFLGITGIMLIFAGNLHHIFIRAIVDSYSLFPPLEAMPMGGFTDLITKTTADSFSIAIRISSPVIVIGLVIYLGGGIIGRLMPQIQVFFIMTPVQILLGFSMFLMALSTGLTWFMNYYSDTLQHFLN
jgi:flagellar biosynthetic protein FliR